MISRQVGHVLSASDTALEAQSTGVTSSTGRRQLSVAAGRGSRSIVPASPEDDDPLLAVVAVANLELHVVNEPAVAARKAIAGQRANPLAPACISVDLMPDVASHLSARS